MTIEKIHHNGHIVISDIVRGYFFKRVYVGHTRKEAVKMFRDARREAVKTSEEEANGTYRYLNSLGYDL